MDVSKRRHQLNKQVEDHNSWKTLRPAFINVVAQSVAFRILH